MTALNPPWPNMLAAASILVCIGIQIGWSGLSALFAGLQHSVALL
jgi:hypothetical protein